MQNNEIVAMLIMANRGFDLLPFPMLANKTKVVPSTLRKLKLLHQLCVPVGDTNKAV